MGSSENSRGMTTVAEETRHSQRRFLQNTARVFGLKVTFVALSFLLSVVLARLLGAAGYGAYTYALAWVVLLGVPAILGMDQLIVRDVAAYHWKSDWGSLKGLLQNANRAVFMASCLLVALGASFSWMISKRMGTEATWTFCVALLRLPLIALTRIRQSALQGLHHVAAGQLPEMLIQPVVLLLLVGAAHSIAKRPLTSTAAMALNLAAMCLAFLVGAAVLRSFLPGAVRAAEPVLPGFSWASSVLPLIFMASAGVLFGQIDTLIVGAIKGAKAVGIYGVADRGAESIAFLFIAAETVFAPTVSRMYAAGEMEKLQRMVTKFTRVTLLLSLPVALTLIIYGESFLRLFYGPQFVDGRGALAILSFGQILSVAMGPVGIILIMTAHESKAAVSLGWGVVANIILNVVMVPRWGLEGAATANTISIVFLNVFLAKALSKTLGIQSWAIGRVSFGGA